MKLTVILLCSCYVAIASGFRNRIANNGETAKEKEFPYQVSLRHNNDHFCGGSLISNKHVLTAAHCVEDVVNDEISLEEITVEVGMITRGAGQTYAVKRVSYYPRFKFTPYHHDVAVVHLTQPVEISDKVSIINLPQANSTVPPGTQVFVSGFGRERYEGPRSPVLKQMDAKIVSLEECQKSYKKIRVIVGNICAKKEKGYGTCEGDSGGPLVDEVKKTVIGVVSGGDDDCASGTPNVYADVSRYLPYINVELNYDQNPELADEKHAINLKK